MSSERCQVSTARPILTNGLFQIPQVSIFLCSSKLECKNAIPEVIQLLDETELEHASYLFQATDSNSNGGYASILS